MKNYYKILGVRETASEEEIRQRWIELSKLYHPDLSEGSKLEEKIKEINEAYQILKHSSTRVEYDLKRAYGQKKRGFHLKRFTLPVSILIVFIIIGTIYFKMVRIPTFSKPMLSKEVDQSNQRSQINLSREMRDSFYWDQIDEISQTNQRKQTNQTNQIDQKNQTNQIDPKKTAQKTFVSSVSQRIDMPTQQPQVAPSTPALVIDSNQANLSRLPCNVSVQGEMQGLSHGDLKAPITQLPDDLITKVPNDPINQINQTNQTNRIDQVNQIDQRDPKIEFVQFKPPSLIATEEEVRQFINNYIARYTQKDIHGFLSFFSPKAIQNQKDGLLGIGKIYTDFFNTSKELQYRIEEMKIGIYQNAVEVKARYEVNQVLKKGKEKKVWRGNIRWVIEKEDGALKIISLDYQHEKSP